MVSFSVETLKGGSWATADGQWCLCEGCGGNRCYCQLRTGRVLCVCNIRSIIPCAFGILAWLGPLVNCLGFAVLCLLSKQMFSIGLFLAVYFLLQNLTFSNLPVTLYSHIAFVYVWCYYYIRTKTFLAKGKVLCMKKETACFLIIIYLFKLDVTENLGSLCQCQTGLDRLGRGRKEGKKGGHKAERIS